MFLKNKLPKKLKICPLVEAIIEIRFETNLKEIEVYSRLGKNLEDYEYQETIFKEIPESIRSKDPNLKFNHFCVLTKDNFRIQIGGNSISIINTTNYSGWSQFYEFTSNIIKTAFNANIIDKPLRIGVRYINFIDKNKIDKFTKLKLSKEDNVLDGYIFLQNEFIENDFRHIVKVSNNSTYNTKSGSAIDIDVIYDNLTLDVNKTLTQINKAHQLAKETFFDLLNVNYLNNLEPEYDN